MSGKRGIRFEMTGPYAYAFAHDDYDDSDDPRHGHGHGHTVEECKAQIDEREDD